MVSHCGGGWVGALDAPSITALGGVSLLSVTARGQQVSLRRCTLWQPWRRHCATFLASTRTIRAAPNIYGSSCARRRAARGVPRSWRGAARSRLRYSLFWPGGCPGPSGGMRTLCMMCVMLPYIKIRSFPLVMILESLKLCLIDTQSLRGTHAFHFPKIWPF